MKKRTIFNAARPGIFLAGLFAALLLSGGLARAEESAAPPLQLSLDGAVKMGLENSPQIKSAEAAVEYARGKVISARSNLMPKVTGSANYVNSNMLPQFKIGEATKIPTSFPFSGADGSPLPPDHIHYWAFPGFEMSSDRTGDVYALKVEGTYPVFTGFRIEQGYIATKLSLDASTVDLRKQKNDLVYNIKQTYYNVLLAQEMIKVVDASYKTMEDHLKQVRELYKEGYVSNLDVIQTEARLTAIKPDQIRAYTGLRLAKTALRNLLYMESTVDFDLTGKLEYEPVDVPDYKKVLGHEMDKELGEIMQRAYNNRPEVKSLDIRKKQADSMIKIAYGGYYPTVALFANYQWNMGSNMPPLDKVWSDGYQVGASASISLFDGFYNMGEVRAAKGQYNQISFGEMALKSGIETEVTSAYLTLVGAKQAMDAENENVKSSRKNFDAQEKRYREGYVNQLDVLDAETQLTAAQANYLRAVANYLISKAGLEKAMGREVTVK
jgi:outer membrane protein